MKGKIVQVSRVCAAIINEDCVLMVQHRENDRIYWTFPGGEVEIGEIPEEAVIREIKEETGLDCKIIRTLFDEKLSNNESICKCFLVERLNNSEPILGYDPEEMHLSKEEKMLRDIAWKNIEENKDDKQIALLINEMNMR